MRYAQIIMGILFLATAPSQYVIADPPKQGQCGFLDLPCKLITGAQTERRAFRQSSTEAARAAEAMRQQQITTENACSREAPSSIGGFMRDTLLEKRPGTTDCQTQQNKLKYRNDDYNKAREMEIQKKKEYEDAKTRTGAWR